MEETLSGRLFVAIPFTVFLVCGGLHGSVFWFGRTMVVFPLSGGGLSFLSVIS